MNCLRLKTFGITKLLSIETQGTVHILCLANLRVSELPPPPSPAFGYMTAWNVKFYTITINWKYLPGKVKIFTWQSENIYLAKWNAFLWVGLWSGCSQIWVDLGKPLPSTCSSGIQKLIMIIEDWLIINDNWGVINDDKVKNDSEIFSLSFHISLNKSLKCCTC